MELPEIITCYLHDMNSDERETRIKKIRDRAEELRAETAEICNPRIRESMLNFARSYGNAAYSLARILARNDYAVGETIAYANLRSRARR
jgi:hypothetical protein